MDCGHVSTVLRRASSVVYATWVCQHVAMIARARFVSFAATVALAALAALTSGCGDDATVECVSNDVGEVCARADGAITFSAEGLEPGSDVELANDMVGPITFTADDDGSFATDQAAGVMSFIVGTEFIFDVTSTDANGRPLTGQIVLASG